MATHCQCDITESTNSIERNLQEVFHQEKRCKLRVKYRLPPVTEKGTIFLIVWNVFLAFAFFSCATKLLSWQTVTVIEYCGVAVLYPIMGIIADCWIGRYKVLKSSQYFVFLAIVLKEIGEHIIVEEHSVQRIAVAALALAGSGYTACILQFIMDQFVGASGEQLTFAIYWLIWGTFTVMFFANIENYFDSTMSKYLFDGLSVASILIAVCMMECCNHLLMKKPLLSNPIKHIAKVLNYARKHKYPVQRSAFTYWEDNYPSRIDLGKDKYGGPFTVEEVEDVKTLFKLVPVIISSTAYFVVWQCKPQALVNKSLFGWLNHSSAHGSTMLEGLLSLIGLPIYRFIIYPLFYNSIPSILRRVGLGMLLMMLSLTCSSIIGLAQTNLTCILHNGTNPDPVSSYWQLVPNLLYCLSFLIAIYTFTEFVLCQSPCQMKGIILTMMFACSSFFAMLGYFFSMIIETYLIQQFLHCTFYHYVLNCAMLVIVFLGVCNHSQEVQVSQKE